MLSNTRSINKSATNSSAVDSDASIYPDNGYIIGYEVGVVLGFKYTAAVLSLIGSLFIMICYMYLSYLVKFKPQQHKKSRSGNIDANNTNNNNNEINENNNTESNQNKEINIQNTNNSNNSNNANNNDYKKLKMGYGHDLIFLLALSDFVLSLSAFIKTSDFNSGKTDAACVAQGVFMNFAEMSSICWTTIIAYSIYLSTKTTGITLIPKYYLYFFIFSYGLPMIFTIIPLFFGGYGPAGAWCWLNTKDLENNAAWVWSLIIYLFNWLNIAFNIYAVTKSIRYFRIRTFEVQEDNLEEANFLKNFCIVLKFFPIILVICWLPATINRIYLFLSGNENTFLYTAHAFFANLTGFLNCVVYSYYYKNLIRLWFCGRKSSNGADKDGHALEMEKIRDVAANNAAKNGNKSHNDYEKNIDMPSVNEKNKEKADGDYI